MGDGRSKVRTPIWAAAPADAPVQLCPCCGHWTLGERGGYESCEICRWEDDRAEEVYGESAPERPIGPNRCHLWQARENYLAFGFSDERYLEEARQGAKRRAFFSLKVPRRS